MTSVKDLPAELRSTVLFYLSQDALLHLISVPHLSNYAFNRCFKYVKINSPKREQGFNSGKLGPGSIFVDSDGDQYLQFFTITAIEQFLQIFPSVTIQKLVLDDSILFFKLVEKSANVLSRIENVQLNFKLDGLYDSRPGGQFTMLPIPPSFANLFLKIDSAHSSKIITSGFFGLLDPFHLKSLWVRNIEFGNFQSIFNQLVNLEELYVSNSRIKDSDLASLPESLKKLTLVDSLKLAGSTLQLPLGLEQLQLTHIEYSENTYEIDLSHLIALKTFGINDDHITHLSDISLPYSLRQLTVANHKHTIEGLELLHQFSKLTSLNLFGCKVSSLVPVLLFGNLPKSLKFLRVYYYGRNDSSFEELKLIAGGLNAQVFENIFPFSQQVEVPQFELPPSLVKLNLETHLFRFKSGFSFPNTLESVVLRLNSISNEPPVNLPRSIKRLCLQSVNQSTLAAMEFPRSLESLAIQDRSLVNISNDSLHSLQFLKTLDLSNNNLMDSSKLFQDIPNSVETLNLSGNKFSVVILKHCANLKRLDLSQAFTSEVIGYHNLLLPSSVKYLDVGSNLIRFITPDFRFPSGLEQLELHLSSSLDPEYNLNGLSYLRSCSHLKSLCLAVPMLDNPCFKDLPAQLEVLLLLAPNVSSRTNGDMRHLSCLECLEFSGPMAEVSLKLPDALQRLSLINCGIGNLSEHMDISRCQSLASLSIRENPTLKENDLLFCLKGILKQSSEFFKIEVDHGNIRYPVRELIRGLGLEVVEHPLV